MSVPLSPPLSLIYSHIGKRNTIISTSVPELASSKPGHLKCASLPSLKFVVSTGREMLEGGLNISETLVYKPNPHPLDSVAVSEKTPFLSTYSASNNGKSDGKTLSQGDVLDLAKKLASKLKLNADDTILSAYKHSSQFGTVANFAAFLSNSNLIVPSGDFERDATVKALGSQLPNVILADKHSLPILKGVQSIPKSVRTGAVDGVTKESLVGVELMAA